MINNFVNLHMDNITVDILYGVDNLFKIRNNINSSNIDIITHISNVSMTSFVANNAIFDIYLSDVSATTAIAVER